MNIVAGVRFPPDRHHLGACGVQSIQRRVSRGANPALVFVVIQPLVMVRSVKHRLAEVSDHTHQRGGILWRGTTAAATGRGRGGRGSRGRGTWSGGSRRGGLGRVQSGEVLGHRIGTRSADRARLVLVVVSDLATAAEAAWASERDVESNGGLDDRLAAREAAGIDQGRLPGGDRAAGGDQEVSEAQLPPLLGQCAEVHRRGDLVLGGHPVAVIVGGPRQGEVGVVDRSPRAGARLDGVRVLPLRGHQVDEAGIDDQPLPLDHLGVERDLDLVERANVSNHTVADDHGTVFDRLTADRDDLRPLHGVGGGVIVEPEVGRPECRPDRHGQGRGGQRGQRSEPRCNEMCEARHGQYLPAWCQIRSGGGITALGEEKSAKNLRPGVVQERDDQAEGWVVRDCLK